MTPKVLRPFHVFACYGLLVIAWEFYNAWHDAGARRHRTRWTHRRA
jgi:hypothetical protein